MSKIIHIVGLGPGNPEHLSREAMDMIGSDLPLFLRTEIHPTVDYLRSIKRNFTAFDTYYQEKSSFSEVYEAIVDTVCFKANELGEIIYAVPGHPWMAETTVEMLAQKAREEGIALHYISGISFLDLLFSRLEFDPIAGVAILDAHSIDKYTLNSEMACVVVQVNHRLIASRVKLALMEGFPDEHPIFILKNLGIPREESVISCPLYELDHDDVFDHLTTIFVPAAQSENRKRNACSINGLKDIMATLRGNDGCPWDREQSHQSLRPFLIEEAYEVSEAVGSGRTEWIIEELGDVLLQVVFHAQIGTEAGTFDFDDIVEAICAKMIRRHPHVFGDITVEGTKDVLSNWDRIKNTEKGKNRKSLLDGIPKELPALMKASKIQEKAARVGFDWDSIKGAIDKVHEELSEMESALDEGHSDNKISEEIGDLLFSVVNVSRFIGVDPETALTNTIGKFYRRFRYIEEFAKTKGFRLEDMSLEEMDLLWEEAKSVGSDHNEIG